MATYTDPVSSFQDVYSNQGLAALTFGNGEQEPQQGLPLRLARRLFIKTRSNKQHKIGIGHQQRLKLIQNSF